MKSFKLFPVLLFLTACGSGIPKYDATGTFEATDVIVSAEATGKILTLDVEEGTTLRAGQEVGVIDTVQLYLKKLQLEANVKSVEGQRPDILKQVAATKEQIVQAQRERDRVHNLLRVGAANQKQLDDAESLLEVLRKQLAAQNSTLQNSDQSLTWQSSSVGVQVAQIQDQLKKCHIASPLTGTVLAKYAGSGRTGGAGNPAIQGCRYGASLSACLYHFRTAVRGEAGTESNGLFGLRQGGQKISGRCITGFRTVPSLLRKPF